MNKKNRYMQESTEIDNQRYVIEYDTHKNTLRTYTPNGYNDYKHGEQMILLAAKLLIKVKERNG